MRATPAPPLAVCRGAVSLVRGATPSWREQLAALTMPRAVIFGERSLPHPDTERLPGIGVGVRVLSEAGRSVAWENPAGTGAGHPLCALLSRPEGGRGKTMDRKERIRAYKESPRTMGVFRVRNAANGKSLVGSSVDVPAMLNRQRFQLESGFHPDRALLVEWREFGSDAFVFETLDTLEPPDEPGHDPSADLKALEEMWLEKLGRVGERGYH